VGTGVIVGIWVGVSEGRGEAVDVGDAAGMVADAAGPHAESITDIRIGIKQKVNTLFIFIIRLFYE
jgi:hypothetical protein